VPGRRGCGDGDQDPPEVDWPPPEPEPGCEAEPKPLDELELPEFEFELLELELFEFELFELELFELELFELELPVLRLAFPLLLLEDEPLDVLAWLELPDWLVELVWWVEPGRATATAPAATTLAKPTAAVVAFSRYRPRSR
jgi:hypothetical protein